MWAPSLATILTRLLTGEGWKNLGLRLNLRKGWPFRLAAWFLPGLLTLFGAAVFFLLFPQYFDAAFSQVNPSNFNIPILTGLAPWAVAVFEIGTEMLLSPIINSMAAFGEEFGWRGYLLPKLLPLGWPWQR